MRVKERRLSGTQSLFLWVKKQPVEELRATDDACMNYLILESLLYSFFFADDVKLIKNITVDVIGSRDVWTIFLSPLLTWQALWICGWKGMNVAKSKL